MISGQRYGGLMLSAEKRPEDLVRVDVIRKHQIITLTRHNITPSFTLSSSAYGTFFENLLSIIVHG